MRLYPPYKIWETEISDINVFNEYMESVTNKVTGQLVGKVDKNGFTLEILKNYSNSFRPRIRGTIKVKDGVNYLSLGLENSIILLYPIIAFNIVFIISAFFYTKFSILLGIPIITIFLWLGGLVFYSFEIT